jgi:hypothetical protein
MGSKMYYSISLIVVTFSLLVMMTGPLTVQAADSGSNSGDGGGGSPDSGSGSGSNSGSDKGSSDNSNNNNNNNPPDTDKDKGTPSNPDPDHDKDNDIPGSGGDTDQPTTNPNPNPTPNPTTPTGSPTPGNEGPANPGPPAGNPALPGMIGPPPGGPPGKCVGPHCPHIPPQPPCPKFNPFCHNPPKCPPGSHLSNGRCVHNGPPPCPKGYHHNGRFCERDIVINIHRHYTGGSSGGSSNSGQGSSPVIFYDKSTPNDSAKIDGATKTKKFGNPAIVGEVKNNGQDTIKFAKVTATYYDVQNHVIGTDMTYTDPADILAGSSAPFTILNTDKELNQAHSVKLHLDFQ